MSVFEIFSNIRGNFEMSVFEISQVDCIYTTILHGKQVFTI